MNELVAQRDGPEMLERANGPHEIKHPKIVGELTHVDRPRRKGLLELLRVAQAAKIELV